MSTRARTRLDNYWSKVGVRRLGRRRALLFAGGAAAGAAFLAACGGSSNEGDKEEPSSLVTKPADTSSQAKRGGVYKWYTASDSPSFDIATASVPNNDKTPLVYNVLLQHRPGHLEPSDREVIGDLAESWEWSPDRLQLTLRLRQGVKWHNKPPVNGRAFDVDDVLFSWDRVSRLSGQR